MKNLCATGLLVACIFAFQSISAQQQPVTQQPVTSKPLTLAQLPSKLECNIPALQKLSAFRKSENVTLSLGNYEFAGEVVEKIQSAAGVLNMNIRSTNMPGALCTISVITDNNTQKLVGRIINPKSDDVLVLTEENNRYFWVKQPREHFMTE